MAVDACLLHGLKRRALGLFKTNSSTALIQKVAKSCRCAQEVVDLVEDEEKRLLSEQTSSRKHNQPIVPQTGSPDANSFGRMAQTLNRSPVKAQVASNSKVYKRNMWIKCALIEKKLVDIVDYLAENASKYYEPEALLSNHLCAQILSSLLMGPSALEFSRSKTSDYYLFEDPSADELLKRHKLTNPIACLCIKQNHAPLSAPNQPTASQHHQQLARSITDGQNQNLIESRLVRTANSLNVAGVGITSTDERVSQPDQQAPSTTCNRRQSIKDCTRRRPLSLKTNLNCGATLLTDCHHYSCQEVAEHRQLRGYSFLSSGSLMIPSQAASARPSLNSSSNPPLMLSGNSGSATATSGGGGQANSQQTDWALWSPRMLHETLHQNSKSSLLYAKNNVLLETQPGQTIAGYLSLHQTCSDLILKWIPNQMINGGQLMSAPSSSGVQEQLDDDSAAGEIDSEQINQDFEERPHQQQPPTSLESSYLDLVVNLSVSRIVLLHCQFGKHRTTIPSGSSLLSLERPSLDVQPDADRASRAVETRDSSAILHPNRVLKTEETLILIETDGVQRSPFKFPKGGLRVFLSCLENGLLPNRYLDPAIRFDDTWPPDDPTNEPPPQQPAADDEKRSASTSDGQLDANQRGTIATKSRFDNFLKRLPSLKNNKPPSKTTCEFGSDSCTPTTNDDNSRNASPDQQLTLANLDQQNPPNKLPTNNCVYRIVSLQQQPPDWPQQTPPHSALSVGSSSSGSFNLMGGSGGQPGAAYVATSKQQAGSAQKFRWSLSRLARFSARYTNSASTSSSSVGGGLFGNYSTSTLPNGSLASLANINQQSSISENYSLIGACGSGSDFSAAALLAEDADQPRQSATELARIEAKLKLMRESSDGNDESLQALRTQSIQTLCDSMRKQIVARAFNGWLVHCRKAKVIRAHLMELIKEQNHLIDETDEYERFERFKLGLTRERWIQLMGDIESRAEMMDEVAVDVGREVNQLVYYGGIESDELRKEVWPYLLEHYKFKEGANKRRLNDKAVREQYESCGRDWIKIERVVKQRDNEILAANMARVSKKSTGGGGGQQLKATAEEDGKLDSNNNNNSRLNEQELDSLQERESSTGEVASKESDEEEEEDDEQETVDHQVDQDEPETVESRTIARQTAERRSSREFGVKGANRHRRRRSGRRKRRARLESTGSVGSDASITDQFGNNVHRIDKDVQRCDRNFWYFKETKNLDKLRNIMCSYVWQHLDVGYVQGMCDLAAPFLVIFDDEVLAYSCFSQLMKRMVANFPHGIAMDQHFERLKYLMQVLDPKLFDVLQSNGDYTHFYFCYRWLLLDFKRGKSSFFLL